jgi:hypothetical protein
MKILSLIFFLLTSTQINAASITVPPFEMELDLQDGYELEGELELSCRYEKLIFGDSSEYKVFYAPVKNLLVSKQVEGEFNRVKIVNNEKLFFEYNRAFHYGKECRLSFKVNFFSTEYATGYGLKPKRAVSFMLWKGFYDYQEGDQNYDLRKMQKFLDNTKYSFRERFVRPSHVNIYILQDGREARTSPWVEKAYLNPETGLPYRPLID